MTNLQTRLLQKMTFAGKLSLFIIAVLFSTGMARLQRKNTPLTKVPDISGLHNKISSGFVENAIDYNFEITGKVSGMRITGNHHGK
ncbi:MAG: hypothetical protein ACO1O6_01320 [Bacteroidota bacterium]